MSDFNPKEFYNFGVSIAGRHTTEVGYRTAIGRLYYSCHLIGINSTKNKGWYKPRDTGDDHSGLRRSLRENHRDALADQLLDLQVLREHADYHTQKCEQGKCSCCDNVSGGELVDEKTWERAKTITDHILPKLESINPENKR